MSEHINHIAIYEDTARLILHDGNLNEAFRISIQNYPDAGLISSASRGNHIAAVPLLEELRDKWDTRKKEDGTEQKIAAALGWLSHRGIDLQIKPMTLENNEISDPRFSGQESEVYKDAVTFEKVYGGGKYQSISPNVYMSEATLAYSMRTHPAAGLIHVDQAESLMLEMVQQNLLALRSANEGTMSPEEWMDKFPEIYQKLGENLTTYIEAFTDPDPLKMERYIYSINFYNEEDDLIRLVRDLQHDGKSKISLDNALAKAENQSHYAQGLRKSFSFIQSANDFFNKKIEKDQMYDQVEIFHEPHRI